MNFKVIVALCLVIFFSGVILVNQLQKKQSNELLAIAEQNDYWFVLHRKSNSEMLYQGTPGNINGSKLVKQFKVKTGIPGERPTPLPQLLGKEYWVITEKHPEPNNPETAPYFITLNIPAPTGAPFGPKPYEECNGQCNWVAKGDFGLHGVETPDKLSDADLGSSGCIRHSDKDITYLYNLLDPTTQEIRYYVEDN